MVSRGKGWRTRVGSGVLIIGNVGYWWVKAGIICGIFSTLKV